MNRLIQQGDMSAAQILATSYDLLAILQLVKTAADACEGGQMDVNDVSAVVRAMALAIELHAPMHDVLEKHEGAK